MLQYRQKLDALTMHKSIISLEMEIIRLKKALEALTGAPENGMGDQDPEDSAGVSGTNYTVTLSAALVSGGTASGTIVDGAPDSGSVTVSDSKTRIPSGKQVASAANVDVVKYDTVYQLTGYSCSDQESS